MPADGRKHPSDLFLRQGLKSFQIGVSQNGYLQKAQEEEPPPPAPTASGSAIAGSHITIDFRARPPAAADPFGIDQADPKDRDRIEDLADRSLRQSDLPNPDLHRSKKRSILFSVDLIDEGRDPVGLPVSKSKPLHVGPGRHPPGEISFRTALLGRVPHKPLQGRKTGIESLFTLLDFNLAHRRSPRLKGG